MIKRRKDGGFTLIELMIVIAVIGILAVVLVPKMTNAKDSAKNAGVVTNAKSVEAYVVANFDKWNRERMSLDTIKDKIYEKFSTNENDRLKNPITNETGLNKAFLVDSTRPDDKPGVVGVIITGTTGNLTLSIEGYDNDGDLIYESEINP